MSFSASLSTTTYRFPKCIFHASRWRHGNGSSLAEVELKLASQGHLVALDGDLSWFCLHGHDEDTIHTVALECGLVKTDTFVLNPADLVFADESSQVQLAEQWELLKRALNGRIASAVIKHGHHVLGGYIIAGGTYSVDIQATAAGDLLCSTQSVDRRFELASSRLHEGADVLISPSGKAAAFLRVCEHDPDARYQETLSQLMGADRAISRWLLLRLGAGEIIMWPNELTFMEPLDEPEGGDSWFNQADPITAGVPLQDVSGVIDSVAASSDGKVQGTAMFDELSNAPSVQFEEGSDNASDVNDADFSFFDEKSPEEILRSIRRLSEGQIEQPPTLSPVEDMQTVSAQDLTTPNVDPYGPGGKFYVGDASSSSSSPSSSGSDEPMEDSPDTVQNIDTTLELPHLLHGHAPVSATTPECGRVETDLAQIHQFANLLAEDIAFNSTGDDETECSLVREPALVAQVSAAIGEAVGSKGVRLSLEDLTATYEVYDSRKPKPIVRKGQKKSLLDQYGVPSVVVSQESFSKEGRGELRTYELLSPAIRLWETLFLRPALGPRDIVMLAIHPAGANMFEATKRLLDDLWSYYEPLGLGQFDIDLSDENGLIALELADLQTQRLDVPSRLAAALYRRTERRLTNVCLLVVNPFDRTDRRFSLLLDLLRNVRTSFQRKGDIYHVTFQLVPAASIADPQNLRCVSPTELSLMARQIYDRAATIDASGPIDPIVLSDFCFHLRPPGVQEMPPFAIDPGEVPSLTDEYTKMHVAYCADGERWVTAAWQDGCARVFAHRQFPTPALVPGAGRSMAANLVEIWRTTMRLCAVFPIRWHIVVCKIGAMTKDELEAWHQMTRLDKSGVKFVMSVVAVDLDPPLSVEVPILRDWKTQQRARIASLLADHAAGKEREPTLATFLEDMASLPAGATATDIRDLFLAIKLSRYQPCQLDGRLPHPVASAYLVCPDARAPLHLAPRVVLWHALKLVGPGEMAHVPNAVDDLIGSWRDLACVARISGSAGLGGHLPRHVYAARHAQTALDRMPWRLSQASLRQIAAAQAAAVHKAAAQSTASAAQAQAQGAPKQAAAANLADTRTAGASAQSAGTPIDSQTATFGVQSRGTAVPDELDPIVIDDN